MRLVQAAQRRRLQLPYNQRTAKQALQLCRRHVTGTNAPKFLGRFLPKFLDLRVCWLQRKRGFKVAHRQTIPASLLQGTPTAYPGFHVSTDTHVEDIGAWNKESTVFPYSERTLDQQKWRLWRLVLPARTAWPSNALVTWNLQ
jgi:hypothetical protein